MLANLTTMRKSRRAAAISGVIEWALAYLFGSIALGSGAVWWYALAIFLLITGVGSFVTAIKPHER